MHVCRSLAEAYQYRRQQLNPSTPEAHLALVDWCLRYNLLADAGRELVEARELDPYHPRVALLERRLAKANEPPSVIKPLLPTTKSVPTPVDKNASSSPTPPQKSPTVLADLPDGALELFARKVQPIVVNSCTTAGCHQPGGRQSFQLDRAVLRGENGRRSTMHNLEATLALIDRDQAGKSPLLTIPHQRHGGMTAPIFGPRLEPAFKNLASWVDLVASPTAKVAPGADAMPPANTSAEIVSANPSPLPSEAVAQGPKIESAAQKKPPAEPAETATPPTSQGASAITPVSATEQMPTLKSPHQLKVGARLQTWQPRDAFDAEIFNRMQRARGNAPAAVAPATAEPTR
jgi:hypothetical protein